MKITITMNNRETNTTERLVNKYVPANEEYTKIENAHLDRKFGFFHSSKLVKFPLFIYVGISI